MFSQPMTDIIVGRALRQQVAVNEILGSAKIDQHTHRVALSLGSFGNEHVQGVCEPFEIRLRLAGSLLPAAGCRISFRSESDGSFLHVAFLKTDLARNPARVCGNPCIGLMSVPQLGERQSAPLRADGG